MFKKKIKSLMGVVATITLVSSLILGCSSEEVTSQAEWQPIPEKTETTVEETPVENNEPEEEGEVIPEGCYRSELTNEWIDESLKDQRPIAVMVDNEKAALPHFGVNSCDIVYEMMNSTLNNRITRLMCILKDYNSVEQLGSVRSTRPTNFMVMAEYDAILCHDGGPFYNEQYYGKSYVDHLDSGFARFSNGKNVEYTEYITNEPYTNTNKNKSYQSISERIDEAKFSVTYTSNYEGPHFEFSDEDYRLSSIVDVQNAKDIKLPFPHNSSELKYNEETGLYEYYVYGEPHVDAVTKEVTTFKNVIIQGVSHTQLDENGYLIYNVIGSGEHGYFITNGEAVPIIWIKTTENGRTTFTNAVNGKDIVLNTGKTYIAIVPDDSWKKLTLG